MKTQISSFVLAILFFASFNSNIKAQKKAKPKIQVALMLDTSGSMNGLIDQAKSQLWKIVNELALAKYNGQRPDLEIALYEYGNDGNPSGEGYIRMLSNLTTDLDKISEDLFALTTNGGEEYCGHVIRTATKQLSWSPSNSDLKIMYIAGNEPFTQGGVNYEKSCKDAIAKGIIVNTIFCGNHQEGINSKWKHGADLSDGKYMNIDQNETIAFIASPYDDEIEKLNNQLNNTYISYGRSGKSKKERQMVQDQNAGSFGKANAVNRAVTKSSANYSNKSWDLVDAADDDDFKMDKIEKEFLPKEMQKMSDKEKVKYIESKKKERKNIQDKIQGLSKKRKEYVAKKRREEGNKNSLDAAMIKSIKEQAKKRNYKFDN